MKPCKIDRRQGIPVIHVGIDGLVTPTGTFRWYRGPCGKPSKTGACWSCRKGEEGELDQLTDKGRKQLAALAKGGAK